MNGKGELTVASSYNNGIATKDDLVVKNLTLVVNCVNNGLKGNDSLTIESGNIKVISTLGDGLKTENTDISSKGNQRGNVTINGGKVQLYVACDGIDASYNAIINGGELIINTERYSEYSGDVAATSKSVLYLRASSRSNLSTNYYYSVKYFLQDDSIVWVEGKYELQNQYRYYKFEKPENAVKIQFFVYYTDQINQDSTYLYASEVLSSPDSFDVFYVSKSANSLLSGQWTNYTTQNIGPGGRPGMEGNSDKASYSCKGIKADNEIIITDGEITIKSHDDAIHTNSDVMLESGYGKGDVTISGGKLILTTEDDGIHADGILTINGGDIQILKSYEGLEGEVINIDNVTVYLLSSDDGINAMQTLNITGGVTYLNANGDGIDSNGTIKMSGGIILAMGPTNGGNGVLDFDGSFSFSGGLLLAIGSSGMNQKPSALAGNTVIAKSISTNTSSYVTVKLNNNVIACIKVTKTNQNYCVLAYNNQTYSGITLDITSNFNEELVNDAYYISLD